MIGAIIGVLGIVKTNELSDLASLMYEREMVGAQHVSAANMDMIEATRSVRSAMLAPTQQERTHHLNDMQQRLDRAKAGLAAAAPYFNTPTGKSKLADTIQALERVQSLLSSRAKNARWTNCKLVFSNLSQFFHNRLFFSNQAKLRSTIQRLGITLNVCSSLRLAICTATCSPRMSWTPWANGRPT